jgi:hypothetical protein
MRAGIMPLSDSGWESELEGQGHGNLHQTP